MKHLPPIKKLSLRSQFQNLIASELSALDNQQQQTINYVLQPSPSPTSPSAIDLSQSCQDIENQTTTNVFQPSSSTASLSAINQPQSCEGIDITCLYQK